MSNEPEPPRDYLAIRFLIRKQALRKTEAFRGYQNLCKKVGDDVIDFEEYSFWYYRFYHGNLDTNHDRSADPEPRTLFELPNELLQKIVSKLDLKSGLASRKVCRRLLQINQQIPKKFEEIVISIDKRSVQLELNNEKRSYLNRYSKTVEESVLRAMDDLKVVLEGSRFEIKSFKIVIGSRNTDVFYAAPREWPGYEEMLQSLRKIRDESNGFHVEKVLITNVCVGCESSLAILALFKPRVLKKFQLGRQRLRNKDTGTAGLHEMDQFKYAEEINIAHLGTIDASMIFDHFQHFKWFRVSVPSISLEQIVRLRDMLTSSAHSRGCIISTEVSLPGQLSSIRKALGEPEEASGGRFGPKLRYHFEIPNSPGAYFVFDFECQWIKVARQPRTPSIEFNDDIWNEFFSD